MINLTILSIVILGFLISGLKSLIKVEENEEAVIERLGRFHRILGSGVHFIYPFIEKPVGIDEPKSLFRFLCKDKISLSDQIMPFPKDDRVFFASNNEQLKVKGELVFRITDTTKAVYEVAYLLDALNQLTASIIQKKLIEVSTDADPVEMLMKISKQVVDFSNEYAVKWGVIINDLKIKQIIDSNGIRHNFDD